MLPIQPTRSTAMHAACSPRLAIEDVQPVVEGGRFAVKCLCHRPVTVTAVIFADGHEQLAANLLWRTEGQENWQRVAMQPLGNDHWTAGLVPHEVARLEFAIEAWQDPYASYCNELLKKLGAGLAVSLELQEGAQLVRRICAQADLAQGHDLAGLVERLESCQTQDERVTLLLAPATAELLAHAEYRPHLLRSPLYPLDVERPLAEFASWYELFPRSESGDARRHGTFNDVRRRLGDIVAMGFDVLYFPPIHPIGRTHRK
ncbi:MAG TPA: maltotransferase domain-containing protein, partial [Pseudomonas sp.]|nr:maltotransferase domain-containing protein [Pseudomonas sp.]